MKRIAETFLYFVDAAAIMGASVAALSLGAIPVLVGIEVLARIALGSSLGITWEYATYLMTLTFVLGAAFTLRTGGHIRVSVLPLGTRTILSTLFELLSSALALAVVLFIAFALSDLAWQTFVMGTVSATPAQTPLFIPRTAIALGAWLLALQFLARIVAMCIGAPVERPAPGADPNPDGEPL
tara:strand:- start:52 stop:600 length:549 start_codon:yes stop_codon:yes gene_type:complete